MKNDFVRKLRQNQSRAETALWQRLRGKKTGFKFRRQQPIGRYIVDFVCLERSLIVELDGDHHQDQGPQDLERQAWLENEGFKVIRFWTREFFQDLENHLLSIYAALETEH